MSHVGHFFFICFGVLLVQVKRKEEKLGFEGFKKIKVWNLYVWNFGFELSYLLVWNSCFELSYLLVWNFSFDVMKLT